MKPFDFVQKTGLCLRKRHDCCPRALYPELMVFGYWLLFDLFMIHNALIRSIYRSGIQIL